MYGSVLLQKKNKEMARKRITTVTKAGSSNRVKAYKLGKNPTGTVVRLMALGALTHREIGLRLE